MTIKKEEVLKRLDFKAYYREHIPSLKASSGSAQATGLCPFHKDTHPSLSVNTENGLFHCFACKAAGDVFAFHQRLRDIDFRMALAELAELTDISLHTKTQPKVVVEHEYNYENGKVVYVKKRLEPGLNGRRKDFFFKHQENGKWVKGRFGPPVLYRLPEIIHSDCVIFVEGERKVDLLHSWGLTATTLDSGCKSKWSGSYIKYLEGKKITILPDNDDPGREYAIKIAKALYTAAKEIRIVELPGLLEKGDIVDWARIPGNDRTKLVEVVQNTPVWNPTAIHAPENSLNLTRLGELMEESDVETSWVVDGLLPTAGFSILVSKPKTGKSTTARAAALCVATGEPFLGKTTWKGAVIYLALEEKRDEIKRHFKDMGATGEEEIHIYVGGAPVDAIDQMQRIVHKIKPTLVIIDPLFRFTRVKDGNDYTQVTNALNPLLRLARDTGTHVLCVHHTTKGDRCAEDSVLGSQAIFGSVDTLMVMKRYENYRTFQTIQRYGSDMPETILEYDTISRSVTVGSTKHDEDINIVRRAILEFLQRGSKPVTEAMINDEVEGKTVLKRKALRMLVETGEVQRDGKGGKGDPYKYHCFHVPVISKEQGNMNLELPGNPYGCHDHSRSQDFTDLEESGNVREQENVFEVEDLEVLS